MRELVETLCSDACAGRKTGTAGGVEARRVVVEALRGAGTDPHVQDVPECRGANVLATIPGDVDRWVLVAAHYDHLGAAGGDVFRGADDNAAAVAILVEVARGLARTRARGRGVIIAAFDAEEPPHFLTGEMGSEYFARHPTVALDKIDMMACMDLVGHAVGPEGLPDAVRQTVFALGAERSAGTAEIVRGLAAAERGVVVRAADAQVIPPLSDYAPFWDRKRPFVLLTSGRSRVYHTPEDVPALLAWPKIEATARWLERFVRATCEREPAAPIEFVDRRNDALTAEALVSLLATLAPFSPSAEAGLALATQLQAACGADGTLPSARRAELAFLVGQIESGLA